MKLYVSNIEESYKGTIIGLLVNPGTSDLLLNIVQCWRACSVNEENRALPMVLYCSKMMYKYYSFPGFFQSNTMSMQKIFTIKYSTIYHISSKLSVKLVLLVVSR